MKEKNAQIILPSGERYTCPTLEGSWGGHGIDIRSLYDQSGWVTYDPGFASTAHCTSSITYIDGDEGILAYRGYAIQELAEKSHFLEVVYLLLYGELPSVQEQEDFSCSLAHHSLIHEQMHTVFRGFRRDAHPMAIMVAAVGALSAFYPDNLDIRDPKQRDMAAHRLIAKIPTMAAMAYKYSVGQPFVYPQNKLSYAENFLSMMFTLPSEPYEVHPVLVKALDIIFLLHADHEQNASTATVRLAGSSGAHPFACIAAGIATLWGPAHGGANEAVLNMLDTIKTTQRIPEFLAKAKDKNDPFRLMGFGHRVYKNYDPRAKILQDVCQDVFKVLKTTDPLLDLAQELEHKARHDDYFISHKLYPNVDFYSGIILKAMGIPTSMFTVLFALARSAGWIAQWSEMMGGSGMRIGRPRQIYQGSVLRPYKNVKTKG